MNKFKKLAAAAVLGVGALAASGCATGLNTRVTRFQAMPAATGQTFYVVPGNGSSGLEFGQYASIVAQQLEARGYRQAASPQSAEMLVRLGYGVDEGQVQYDVDPYAGAPFAYGGGYWGHYGRPYWSRFGYWGAGSPFYYGWNDPFWGGGLGGYDEYIVYNSQLNMDILRKADNVPLFEGRAKARSRTDELPVLVPNLIEAMFSRFPGHSGETVKITVPARKKS